MGWDKGGHPAADPDRTWRLVCPGCSLNYPGKRPRHPLLDRGGTKVHAHAPVGASNKLLVQVVVHRPVLPLLGQLHVHKAAVHLPRHGHTLLRVVPLRHAQELSAGHRLQVQPRPPAAAAGSNTTTITATTTTTTTRRRRRGKSLCLLLPCTLIL